MHHKYVVRDGEAVWTGSMNWTLDSWTREENVIATVDAPGGRRGVRADFEQIWRRRRVEDTGDFDSAAGRRRRAAVVLPAAARSCRSGSRADRAGPARADRVAAC